MDYTPEGEDRIMAALALMRPGPGAAVSLCQYGDHSCCRCCLAHIGGDSPLSASGVYYQGPGGLELRWRNFNPLQGPRINASQYEDAFTDAGRQELERRYAARRALFLAVYDRSRPEESLRRYMRQAQTAENYHYRHAAQAGPFSMFIGGTVSARQRQDGALPECQLLGFVDERRRVGCLAHPLAETAQGYDGRDRFGFFQHTGCCAAVGCEASREFKYISRAARGVFDRAVAGLDWYEYSRHAISVLVYYLRAYDFILSRLDETGALSRRSLANLAAVTNRLYDTWPWRSESECTSGVYLNAMELLLLDIPLPERILYIALGSTFGRDKMAEQLVDARNYVNEFIRQS